MNVYEYINMNNSIVKYREVIENAIEQLSYKDTGVLKINNTLMKFKLNKIIYIQYNGERLVGFVYDNQQCLIRKYNIKNYKRKNK